MPAGTLAAPTQRRFRSASVQSPIETYLSEIRQTPLLSAEAEQQLALRIEHGDAEARDHMVRANLRLVVTIARGYAGKGLGMQDLIAEGNLGLIRAAEGFDPSMNTRFSTYASYWIKQSIKRVVINTGKTVRIPAYMNELMLKWRRASARLHDELRRAPSHEEIAAHLKLSQKKLGIIKKAIRIYNATPQNDQLDGPNSALETLIDDGSPAPETEMLKAEDVSQVLALLEQMDRREAAVLRLRFGLPGAEPMTLSDIGARLNLTRERVRQIEGEALAKLRDRMEAD
jgi:RNA polymerase primary sigma factor